MGVLLSAEPYFGHHLMASSHLALAVIAAFMPLHSQVMKWLWE
jgi:hypothetical protein